MKEHHEKESQGEPEIARSQWWQILINNMTSKSNGKAREFLLAAAVALFSTTVVEAQTPAPTAKQSQIQHEVYIDPYWGHEFWLKWKSRDGFLVTSQNHMEADGKSGFSYVGLGKEFAVNKNLKISSIFGPQYSLNSQEITHASLFANASLNLGKLRINSINRFAMPITDNAKFMNRHVQNVEGVPGMPKNTGLQFEERRGPAGVDELFLGAFWKKDIKGAKIKIQAYADVVGAKKGGSVRVALVW